MALVRVNRAKAFEKGSLDILVPTSCLDGLEAHIRLTFPPI